MKKIIKWIENHNNLLNLFLTIAAFVVGYLLLKETQIANYTTRETLRFQRESDSANFTYQKKKIQL